MSRRRGGGLAITVERDALKAVLDRATKAMTGKILFPALAGLRLAAADRALRVTATDMEHWYEGRLAEGVTLDRAGDIVVPADPLLAIVKALPKGTAVELSEDGSRLAIAAAAGRWRLPLYDIAEFPACESPAGSAALTVAVPALLRALAAVAMAVSTEETRYYLNGVYLAVQGDGADLVATNGAWLARRVLAPVTVDETWPPVIVPRGTLPLLSALLAGEQGDATLITDGKRLEVRASSGERVVTKLIDGTFPDWQRVVTRPAHEILVPRAALREAVRLVTTVLVEAGKTRHVALRWAGGALALLARHQESVAEWRIDGAAAGTAAAAGEIWIGLNALYLLQVLDGIAADQVSLRHDGAEEPVLFAAAAGAADFALQMPVRIDRITLGAEGA